VRWSFDAGRTLSSAREKSPGIMVTSDKGIEAIALSRAFLIEVPLWPLTLQGFIEAWIVNMPLA